LQAGTKVFRKEKQKHLMNFSLFSNKKGHVYYKGTHTYR
jgi:hypothetical protein